MARWGGGPATYRALHGPPGPEKHEILYTLQCVREVRDKVDRGELKAVQMARAANISWTEPRPSASAGKLHGSAGTKLTPKSKPQRDG
jgi:hypothetical protein